jgi:thioredoxin reductase (NADPH)
MATELLTPKMKEDLGRSFRLLRDDVTLMVFTQEGHNDTYNESLRRLITELAAFNDKLKAEFHVIGDAESDKFSVLRSPTLLISPDRYNIRFTGAPLGEEGRSLVMSIIMASTAKTSISGALRAKLKKLRDRRHVMIFSSPT